MTAAASVCGCSGHMFLGNTATNGGCNRLQPCLGLKQSGPRVQGAVGGVKPTRSLTRHACFAPVVSSQTRVTRCRTERETMCKHRAGPTWRSATAAKASALEASVLQAGRGTLRHRRRRQRANGLIPCRLSNRGVYACDGKMRRIRHRRVLHRMHGNRRAGMDVLGV